MSYTRAHSCMSSNLVATRAFVLLKRVAGRERAPIACPTIVMQLHVFQLACNSTFFVGGTDEERGELHVPY